MDSPQQERREFDKAQLPDEGENELFDPFEQLFKMKPSEPGDYRRADDGRDF